MAEHRPTVILQIDIFPEDSFLLDGDEERVTYTPEEVAVEAWNNIQAWAEEGYQPVMEVFMPDGTQHLVDIERVRRRG